MTEKEQELSGFVRQLEVELSELSESEAQAVEDCNNATARATASEREVRRLNRELGDLRKALGDFISKHKEDR